MCEQLTSVIQPVSTADPGQQSCCSDSSFLIIIHSLLEKTHENSLISLEAVWNNLTAWAWFFTSFNKMRLKDLNTERTDWTRGETILNGVLLFPGWGRVPSLLLQDDRWFSFCRFSWKVVTSVCSRLTASGKHPSSSFSFRLYEVLSFSDFFNQFLSKTKTQTSSRSSLAQTLQEDMRHSTTKTQITEGTSQVLILILAFPSPWNPVSCGHLNNSTRSSVVRCGGSWPWWHECPGTGVH